MVLAFIISHRMNSVLPVDLEDFLCRLRNNSLPLYMQLEKVIRPEGGLYVFLKPGLSMEEIDSGR